MNHIVLYVIMNQIKSRTAVHLPAIPTIPSQRQSNMALPQTGTVITMRKILLKKIIKNNFYINKK